MCRSPLGPRAFCSRTETPRLGSTFSLLASSWRRGRSPRFPRVRRATFRTLHAREVDTRETVMCVLAPFCANKAIPRSRRKTSNRVRGRSKNLRVREQRFSRNASREGAFSIFRSLTDCLLSFARATLFVEERPRSRSIACGDGASGAFPVWRSPKKIPRGTATGPEKHARENCGGLARRS